jgi:two-component system NtrC family sensor kinase
MAMQEYRRLRWQITATTLAFSLIPLLAMGYVIHGQFSTAYTEKVMTSMASTVANKRRSLDIFLDERVAQLRTLGQTHSFAELAAPGALAAMFGVIQANSRSYIDLGVIDAQGRHVAYVGPYKLAGVNYSAEQWFAEAMLKGQYLSDVFLGFRNFPHFIIAVRCGQGDEAWLLRATIDSEVFNSLVQSLRTGRTGDAFLVNEASLLQTPTRFGGNVLQESGLPAVSLFHGERVEETTLRGQRLITGQSWLTRTRWMLVVTEDPDEAMSPLFRTRSIGALAMGVVALMIVTGTVLTSRSMVAKLEAADRERAALDAGLMQSAKMAALGKLAAGVAHEINNPLTLIMESAGWIKDLLTEENPETIENFTEIESAVHKIEDHVERARAVTHRMLGFARRMEPVEEDVDMNHVAEQTLSFLRSEAMHRDIALRRDYAPDLPRISTDTAQVQQVLLNILENAIDAVGRNGTVAVATGRTENGQGVWLCVSDTGPGIPEAYLSRIFDPFFTTKAPGEGTGLGLSIAYSIIRKLGGQLVASNGPRGGAVFTITLPLEGHGAGHAARVAEEA